MTHRHIKSGRLYDLVTDNARIEAEGLDGEPQCVYMSQTDGRAWIRPKAEFNQKFVDVSDEVYEKERAERTVSRITYPSTSLKYPDVPELGEPGPVIASDYKCTVNLTTSRATEKLGPECFGSHGEYCDCPDCMR